MKSQVISILAITLFLNLTTGLAQTPMPEKYQRLPFGSIQPSGWLKAQMQTDMAGFVGNLDRLVPELINDPIYAEGRLSKHSRSKDLGNIKEGDATSDEQFKWWNSETQSNWWDGFIRNALLLDDEKVKERVRSHIERMLATQDDDGYLGIYDKELRYHFTSENGELWSKATLYRGLLAYFEHTGDQKVWNALLKAVDNVMVNYLPGRSKPFKSGTNYNGGVAHGLTFTDVLDRMYQLTGDKKYWDYARFLYRDFSANFMFEKDAQLKNILDPRYKLQSHGVHTYEHLRPLITSFYDSGNDTLGKALDIYLSRIESVTTMTGGAIGDEWIGGRTADATLTGYEYCSLQELLDSYIVLLQKRGDPGIGDKIETIFYNAAQGSRNPDHSCIAYLKTDNSYEMLGTRNGETEAGHKQTRYKYSPAHQDVAVCCVPNAGRITPYFLQSSWLKEGEKTLVASLLCPNILETTLLKIPVKIEEITDYPYKNHFVFGISARKAVNFQLKIRKPGWATSVQCNKSYRLENGFLVFDCHVKKTHRIELTFLASVQVKEDRNHEKYYSYGALVYARPIAASEQKGREYAPGFTDLMYAPMDSTRFDYIQKNEARYLDGKVRVNLKNRKTQKPVRVELIPMGKTILRQVSFK